MIYPNSKMFDSSRETNARFDGVDKRFDGIDKNLMV
jgi:hypothetical protein